MDDELKELLTNFVEELLYLRQQTDESFLNEIALIQTLKELVPGFGPRFDQLRMTAEKTFLRPDEKTLEALRTARRKMIQ